MPESQGSTCLTELELLDLADGTPSPLLRSRAEGHVDGCSDCREQLAGFLRARASAASASAARPTEVPSTEVLGARPRSRPELAAGTLLGRYMVLERVGAGGMGVVYTAYDPSIDRRIVLKLVDAESGSALNVEQRMREAQAAARTQHPHVVAVHDVGTFQDQVFIAMEWVDGGTLRHHLASAKPPWHEVVRLYLQAGRGLAAAHAAGVIHRDFKPDNVLVDRTGRVRVTDFGLARLAPSLPEVPALESARRSAPPVDASGSVPRHTSVAGTPGYIAPEVLAGRPADARSDQYGFCVSLYEGLHGARPASRAEHAPALNSAVPRAVSAVIARGLAPVPEDRHASLEALLEALERAAFPRTRRRVFAAATAGVGAVVLAVFLLRPAPCADASPRLAGVWDAGRKEALLRAFTASGVPTAQSLFTATSRALDAYARSWTEAHRDACEATRVRGEQSEAALDLRMHCLERRQRELGALTEVLLTSDAEGVRHAPEAAQALTPLDTCADVEALAQPVPRPTRPEVAHRVDAALTRLEDARAHLDAGRWAEALRRAREVATDAEAVGYKPLLGEALLIEGRAHAQLRDEKEAVLRLRRAALASQAGRDDPGAIEALSHLVYVEGGLSGHREQADQWAEQAHALIERIGDVPRLEALLLYNQGTTLARQGRNTEALPLLEKALKEHERLYGPENARVGQVLSSLGLAVEGQGRLADALEYNRRAQSIAEHALGPEHPSVAALLNNQGALLATLGRHDEARACFEKSLSLFEASFGPGKPEGVALILLGNIGALHSLAGHFDEAARTLERNMQVVRAHFPPGHPDRVQNLGNLSVALLDAGRRADALAAVDELAAELDAATAGNQGGVLHGASRARGAEVLLRAGQVDRSLSEVRKAVTLLRALSASSELAQALCQLSDALRLAGHLPEAQRAAEEAVSLLRNMPGSDSPIWVLARASLGEVLLASGDVSGARATLEQALKDGEKFHFAALDLAPTRFALARALRLGRAEPARTRALANAAREAAASTPEPRRVSLAELDTFLRVP